MFCRQLGQHAMVFRTVGVKATLSNDVVSGTERTSCNKIDKPLVVYKFTGNIMTSITTLPT